VLELALAFTQKGLASRGASDTLVGPPDKNDSRLLTFSSLECSTLMISENKIK
jgi:hypothetical protein